MSDEMTPFLTKKHTHSFHIFDADGDGKVARADHDRIVRRAIAIRGLEGAEAEAFEAQMAGIWEQLEAMVDKDGDHAINLEEWLAFQGALVKNRDLWEQAVGGNVQQLLMLIDVDGDGALDRTEYGHLLAIYDVDAAKGDVAFPKLDLDGDGKISTDELMQLVRQWCFSDAQDDPGNWIFGGLD